MKRKDGINNIFYSLLGQFITILLGILVPKLFVETLGSEVNGLLQTINQVFACFTLIEAGIGTATIQALYRPVATEDRPGINAILSATSRYYKKVAVIYLAALLAFGVIFCFAVRSALPKAVIFGVVFFTGFNSVINFTVQEKYKLLLDVSGKKYITTNTMTTITVLSYAAKIALLLMGYNILIIQMSYFFINLLQVFIISAYVKKRFPWLDMSVPPDYPAIAKKNSVMVHQFSGLVFSNTDVLILTVVCGLGVASIYSMYKLIASMLSTLFTNVSSGLTFILGQTYSTDVKLFKVRIDVFNAAYQAFGFAVCTVAYIFYLPFMRLYTAGFDQNYIFPRLPLLFLAIELFNVVRTSSNNTINMAGHFKETQWRSLLETGINLSTSIVLVFYLGIEGVLYGTILALLYRSNDMILYANHVILRRSAWGTYKVTLLNIALMAGLSYLSRFIPYDMSGYVSLLIGAALTGIAVLPIFYGTVFLCCPRERRVVLQFLGSLRRGGK